MVGFVTEPVLKKGTISDRLSRINDCVSDSNSIQVLYPGELTEVVREEYRLLSDGPRYESKMLITPLYAHDDVHVEKVVAIMYWKRRPGIFWLSG